MQTHNTFLNNKEKEEKGNKGEPKSKTIEIKDNILEIKTQESKEEKSNSFSYSKQKTKREIILNDQLKNTINSLSCDNDKETKNDKQNFVLKSEIYNNENESIKSKNNLIKQCTDKARLINNYFQSETNNILRNAQLIDNNTLGNILNSNSSDKNNSRNNIYITNNIIQNNPINYFFPVQYQNYYQSGNPCINNFYNYNYNRINSKYLSNYHSYIKILNSNTKNINNINIKSNYISLIKTQLGCKMLQEKILLDETFSNEILFPEIKNNLKELTTNIFGPSFFRVLFKRLRYENLNAFLDLIKDDFNNICLTESGSHTIQSLIENIHQYPLLLNKFIFYLNNKDIKLIFLSPYGCHIFKHFLTIIKEKEYTNFIFNFIYKNFIDISKEKYGV